ncbi:hypothetical protein [Nonomuraea typhae]|uniref:Uncharacterized protein n=1 Tax=Nonomuraea typhae TaxID=2603600 RepID=A0ABW7Z8I8_9ACTN
MAEPRKKPATKSGKAKKATIKATRQAKAVKRQATRKPMDEARPLRSAGRDTRPGC